jgi:hypothetical protein
MRDAVPRPIELCLILVVQVDGKSVGRELEGDTVPHQTGPDDGNALDIARAHLVHVLSTQRSVSHFRR